MLYISGACSNTSSVGFWTRAHANRGHRARSSIPRVARNELLEHAKASWRPEHSRTGVHEDTRASWQRLRSSTLEYARVCSSILAARAERARLFLCSSVPSISLCSARACSCTTLQRANKKITRAQPERKAGAAAGGQFGSDVVFLPGRRGL